MFEDIDLNSIQDENARQLIVRLLNLVEDLSADLRAARAENQRLRDEINRLKGEQGKPGIRANKPGRADHSSEKERYTPKRRQKDSKQAKLEIDREETLTVDPGSMPADAKFKGYEDVMVQDILFRRENVCFHKAKYYAASTGKSYLAALPAGYAGQFGPGIKALSLALYYGGQMSEPKILELYADAGVHMSAGQLSNLLIKDQGVFEAEKETVYVAGLESSPWQHTDHTSTRVNGENQYCQIVCNPLYTVYRTTPSKDRLSVLDGLRNGRERRFRLNAEALGYLATLSLSPAMREVLNGWCSEQTLDEARFMERLTGQLPGLHAPQRKAIVVAAAVAAYHAEVEWPRVQLLVCDDAPQFNWLSDEMGLCWVHEGRHYKKLMPVLASHRRRWVEFQAQFWAFYHQLLAYRQQPSAAECRRLDTDFDQLFSTVTGYAALDARIAKTRSKKPCLLAVLRHPEIPLHNNPAELAARQRVRKRDVSFGPRTQDGVRAWDTFMSLAATTRKLGISFYQYLHDRISKANQIPSLAHVIQTHAQQLALGASWAAV